MVLHALQVWGEVDLRYCEEGALAQVGLADCFAFKLFPYLLEYFEFLHDLFLSGEFSQ